MKSRFPKRRPDPAAAHADDWLMTYADLITLLLCFFAIFLSVSAPKKDIDKELVRPVHEAGKAPDILEGNLPLHGTPRAEAPTVALTEELADSLSRLMESENQPAPTVERKGDRITVIEMDSAAFFDRGSATLSDAGATILSEMAQNLSQDTYKDYIVTVEGHTDDTPIHTLQFPSNWELSTGRAAAVVQFLIGQGLPAPRLRAAGYADTFPKLPNRDSGGNALPENQAQNRRVVLKLEKIDKYQD